MNRAKAYYRTVTKNEIKYWYFVGEKNERKEGEIILYGDVPIEVLEMRLRKEIKNTRATIASVRRFDIYGKMSFEKFLENCDVISIKERE